MAELQGRDEPDTDNFAQTEHGDWGAAIGRCQHCGQSLRYGTYYLHKPTGELLAVGLQCATKLDLPSREAIADRAHTQRRVLAKVRGRFLSGDPRARQAVEACTAEAVQALRNYEGDGDVVPVDSFLCDLGRKFERDGHLSDKQLEAAWWAAERARQHTVRQDLWEQERAERDKDREPVPVTDERIRITGTIIKTDTHEYDGPYGPEYRDVMTVQDDRGWLVWGTKPGSLGNVQKDDRVTFMARVEPSTDREETDWQTAKQADPYFGFFKRPTKAEALIPLGNDKDSGGR